MIRLLIASGDRTSKTQTLRRSRHGRHNRQRFIDRPLSTRLDSMIQRLPIDIIATQNVSDEHAMEFTLFQKPSKLDPMFDRVEISRSIVWMLPETGALVPGAYILLASACLNDNTVSVADHTHFNESIENQPFLGRLNATIGGSHVVRPGRHAAERVLGGVRDTFSPTDESCAGDVRVLVGDGVRAQSGAKAIWCA